MYVCIGEQFQWSDVYSKQTVVREFLFVQGRFLEER